MRRKKIVRFIMLNHLLRTSRRRKYWVHPLNQQRKEDGEHLKIQEMYEKYPDRFFQYTRLSPAMFDKLLSIVSASIQKQDTNYRDAVSVRVRLYVLLR